MNWSRRFVVVAVVALALPVGATQGVEARPLDRLAEVAALPVLLADSGFGGEALALNDRGLIVGDVLDEAGTAHAAIWSGHALRLIPTRGLIRSTALDVNNDGLIVGQGLDASSNRHGFTYRRGVFRLLREPFPGGTDVQVRRVNRFGEIIGTAADLTGVYHAVRWQGPGARPVVLAPLPGDGGSFAHGVNDEGTVAGSSDSADGSTAVPVLWNHRRAPHPLVWTHGSAEAFAINDRSEVTGAGLTGSPDDPSTQSHILVWRSGSPRDRSAGPRDLGTLPGDDDAGSLAISQRGIVVGFSASDFLPTDTGNVQAVVWLGHGRLRDLPRRANDNYSTAHDVNEHGQIAGLVGDTSGLTRPALWQLRAT